MCQGRERKRKRTCTVLHVTSTGCLKKLNNISYTAYDNNRRVDIVGDIFCPTLCREGHQQFFLGERRLLLLLLPLLLCPLCVFSLPPPIKYVVNSVTLHSAEIWEKRRRRRKRGEKFRGIPGNDISAEESHFMCSF